MKFQLECEFCGGSRFRSNFDHNFPKFEHQSKLSKMLNFPILCIPLFLFKFLICETPMKLTSLIERASDFLPQTQRFDWKNAESHEKYERVKNFLRFHVKNLVHYATYCNLAAFSVSLYLIFSFNIY